MPQRRLKRFKSEVEEVSTNKLVQYSVNSALANKKSSGGQTEKNNTNYRFGDSYQFRQFVSVIVGNVGGFLRGNDRGNKPANLLLPRRKFT